MNSPGQPIEKAVPGPEGDDGFIARILSPGNRPEDRRAKTVFFLSWYVPLVLLGLFTPETILRDHAWACEFVDFMAQIVPQIDRLPRLKIDVEINQFVYSAAWAVAIPVTGQVVFVSWRLWKNGDKGVPFGLGILFVVGLWATVILIDNAFFPGASVRTSRFALLFFDVTPTRALLAPLVAMFGLGSLAVLAAKCLFILRGLWRRRGEFLA
jgi:hypothetical protein